MARSIMHDAFARFTLYRESVINNRIDAECAWCGYRKKETSLHNNILYRYYTVNDDSLRNEKNYCADGKLFCSIGCMRNYNS